MRWRNLFIIFTVMKICMILLVFFGFASKFQSVFTTRFEKKFSNEELFSEWMNEYSKKYESVEEISHRFKIFKENYLKIEILNKKHANSGIKFEINKFADLSEDEFQRVILMPKRSPIDFSTTKYPSELMKDETLPNEFDWSTKGIVGRIRDQGSAGTCWAFSAVQTIETQWALKTGKVVELSVEQVVDCDSFHDNKHADCGVFGGWPYLAYQYIQAAGGIQLESDYPYCCGLGGDKGTCYVCPAKGYNKTLCGPPVEYCKANDSCAAKLNPSNFVPGLELDGWKAISQNETIIAQQLVTQGPLSVLINSGTLQFYKTGVWDPIICDPSSLDHAVLLVGYGSAETILGKKDYWKVKNSWGEKWGEEGYFRIARNKGKCGINTQVTSVDLKSLK